MGTPERAFQSSPLPNHQRMRRLSPIQAEQGERQLSPSHLHGEPVPRVLYVSTTRPDVLIESGDDGLDFILMCSRHSWAAPAVLSFADCGACPHCLLEADDDGGRRRYLALLRPEVTILGFER